MKKRDIYHPIPEGERITEFSSEDFRENSQVTGLSDELISKEDWENFDPLVIIDGNHVYQYAEEFPIVVYRGKEDIDIQPCPRLNGFIESITVSTVDYGMRFSLKKRKMKGKIAGGETVAYFVNNIGECIAVPQEDVYKILLKKPQLTVTSKGMLVFYTDKDILATIDCNHYAWVNIFVEENYDIVSIEDCGDGTCIVHLVQTDNEYYEEPKQQKYKVKFDIDLTDRGMIRPDISKIATKKKSEKEQSNEEEAEEEQS